MHALMSPDFGRVEETPSAAVDKEANSHLSPSEQNFGFCTSSIAHSIRVVQCSSYKNKHDWIFAN